MRNFKEAEEQARQAIALSPGNAEAAYKETETFHCRWTENLVDVNHAIP